jgi:putative ABC transport system permease protein
LLGPLDDDRVLDNFIIRRDYLIETVTNFGFKNEIRPLILAVGVDRAEHIGMVIKEIDENFANSDDETLTATESDSIANALSFFGNIRAVIYSLCVIVLISVLLIAANSMAMNVRERLADVAVMRALGFGRGWGGAQLLGEALGIGLFGGVVGASLAFELFMKGANLGLVAAGLASIQVTPLIALQGFVVAIAISVVSALLPVAGALRLSPAAAFRPIV